MFATLMWAHQVVGDNLTSTIAAIIFGVVAAASILSYARTQKQS